MIDDPLEMLAGIVRNAKKGELRLALAELLDYLDDCDREVCEFDMGDACDIVATAITYGNRTFTYTLVQVVDEPHPGGVPFTKEDGDEFARQLNIYPETEEDKDE